VNARSLSSTHLGSLAAPRQIHEGKG